MSKARNLRTATAFGWFLSHMQLPAGASYRYMIVATVPRAESPAIQLWTKGLVKIVNSTPGSAPIGDRAEGCLTSELDEVVEEGMRVVTASEDSEWWCIDANKNGGQLPVVGRVQIAAGEIWAPDERRLVMVCHGEVMSRGQIFRPGESFAAEPGVDVLCTMPAYLMTFDRPAA